MRKLEVTPLSDEVERLVPQTDPNPLGTILLRQDLSDDERHRVIHWLRRSAEYLEHNERPLHTFVIERPIEIEV